MHSSYIVGIDAWIIAISSLIKEKEEEVREELM